jgi:hypothetical protein
MTGSPHAAIVRGPLAPIVIQINRVAQGLD